MKYEYMCVGCAAAEPGTDGCIHLVEIPMKKFPRIGSKRKCVGHGCIHKMVRVVPSGIGGIVKGQTSYNWKEGETMRMKLPDGREGRFSFVDHKHTDPYYQRNLAQLAGANHIGGSAAGLSCARYDEKHGRVVVDVASNIADPLGAIERSKREGTYEQTTHKVNQPYRVRKKKK